MGYKTDKCWETYQNDIKELLEIIDIKLSDGPLTKFSEKFIKVILSYEIYWKSMVDEAKLALEEAFTPKLQKMIEDKIKEEDEKRDK